MPPEEIDATKDFSGTPEIDRLRHFKEINADAALKEFGLTGIGQRITIMGEVVDASHPDLAKRVITQYNAFSKRGEIIAGQNSQVYQSDLLTKNDGHGTHIAGTIAANCDGKGVQGIACESTLDVYDIGAYDNIDRFTNIGWGEVSEFERILEAFTASVGDVTRRGESKIVTGSFNIEAPSIPYTDSSALYGRSLTEIINTTEDEVDSVEELVNKGYAIPKNEADKDFLKKVISDNDGDHSIGLMSLLPISSTWMKMTNALAEYQRNDGVYIVTESNYRFNGRTSALNALPSTSTKIDPDLWISVVMVEKENIHSAKSDADLDRILAEEPYTTTINSCGIEAKDYCIVTPSYAVLSTMTKRVSYWGAGPLINIDDRWHQILSGHSMGAPMVAATLALMKQHNERKKFGYSTKDLVKILKSSADRTFIGYDESKHGRGMLDVASAIKMMEVNAK